MDFYSLLALAWSKGMYYVQPGGLLRKRIIKQLYNSLDLQRHTLILSANLFTGLLALAPASAVIFLRRFIRPC